MKKERPLSLPLNPSSSFAILHKNSVVYTRRFIMYSRNIKNYYRKTVGHVFTKSVQIQGTTQNFFLSKLFFIVVYISATR